MDIVILYTSWHFIYWQGSCCFSYKLSGFLHQTKHCQKVWYVLYGSVVVTNECARLAKLQVSIIHERVRDMRVMSSLLASAEHRNTYMYSRVPEVKLASARSYLVGNS